MENKRIPFEQLPITDRFMFAMVFSHKEIAKPFLEAVLGIKIHELRDPEPEKTVEVSPFYKGIRYDVFVKETGPGGETLRSFDIEMQMEDTKEIPKRTRYYQAMCDSESLNKGEVYYNLKELYIMFLCPEDIFGQGKAVYRFKNLEVDNPKIELGDFCFKNFYIFNKYREVAEKSIREYMEYFATRKPSSPETKKIDRMVKWYQTDNETRKRYMTWQQEIDIAVDQERQRANDAERRLFEAKDLADAEKARADEAERLASEERARADKYEKMLRDLGKL
ncbi:Rpn family recombination-promoting nuclease/putative transposase [Fibrobacter sp.]|uniref:Rpn family recombination-promoting nuclease/putative transposase n=1 Tax=Fibrobacter sp. TaxID=35828 RepID=UPI0025C2B515|nr:Rpn family recombination-promoting nuclease/putative transposase [Fibrobacter sp.]MBR4006422.1 Rpn family recombination-promoting nuclease/putative transposase [Fibrobacter sp.]